MSAKNNNEKQQWKVYKRQWKTLKRRVKAMPTDYQYVYKEMQKYIFKTVELDNEQCIALFTEIIELFEEGVSAHKHVLTITSQDVAGFCDSLTEDYSNYYDQVQAEVEASIKKALSKQKK